MRWRTIRDRVRGLWRREETISDIDEEMRAHLELLEEEHRRRGLSPEDARAAARRAFGDASAARDSGYDVRGGGGLEALWHDLRFAARTLRRNKGVTASALLTWALGIGATVAVFSVVYPVLLRGLPFRDADRLVQLRETNPPKFASFSISPGNFLTWQKENKSFERMAATQNRRFTLTGGGEPERVTAWGVTPGFFELYGVAPLAGRTLLSEEEEPGHDAVAVLSNGYWQRRFGAAPGTVGSTITLDDRSYTVVGIMPPGLHRVMGEVDLWVPAAITPKQRENYGGHSFQAVGRLEPGVTVDRALAELNVIAARLEAERPDSNAGWRVLMRPLSEAQAGDVRPSLMMLAVAVVFVLLIAAANVANLLVGRASAREREIAVRAALGAGRGRLLRQIACESLLLSLIGGAIGLAVAIPGVELLLALAPRALDGVKDIHLDLPLCAFALAASTVTGLLVAIIPARKAVRKDLAASLHGGPGGGVAIGHTRTRRALIAVEVAACMLLLIGAGLVVRSLGNVLAIEPGFRAENLLKLDLGMPEKRYPDGPTRTAFVGRVLDELRALPGVQSVAAVRTLPFERDVVFSFAIEGRPADPPGKEPSANYYSVTADYFHTMGISIVQGRGFEGNETEDSRRAIINEKLARAYFPDGDAIGKRIWWNDDRKLEIVGVAADVKQYDLAQPATYQLYEPLAQFPSSQISLAVRATGDPAALGASIRARVSALDPAMPITALKTVTELVDATTASRRFSVFLFGVFAVVALLLAIVGIYGVIADAVTQRTREIGLRMALGATPGQVVRAMMGVGVIPAAAGMVLGLGAAAAAARLLRGLLFGVTEMDPLTWIAASLAIALIAALASWLPARRATRVDPMIALRFD